jgi:hypothetical protein
MLKLPWYDVKFPFSYDLYYIEGQNILMFYLDTTLYDKELTGHTCYDTVTGRSHDELKSLQHEFILQTLDKQICSHRNIRNIIFYGHEPLFAMKAPKPQDPGKKDKGKKDKEKKDKGGKDKKEKKEGDYKQSKIPELLKFLFDLKKYHTKLNFTWICADFHVYQNTELRSSDEVITQLIFGTGGGDLDYVDSNESFNLDIGNVRYTLNILANNSDIHDDDKTRGMAKYGYGEITINSTGVNHVFINCGLPPMITSNSPENVSTSNIKDNEEKRKYFKYKQKYLELKKLIKN